MPSNKDINLSYWETRQYLKPYDLIVVGSGIVGLSAAISFRQKHKRASVLVVDKGILPDGASTKNAGFACFGSAGELLDDLASMPESSVWQTVDMRWKGLELLRGRFGDKALRYEPLGGFELFDKRKDYDYCRSNLDLLNKQIKTIIGQRNCFTIEKKKGKLFSSVVGTIKNNFEGQLDTGLMMQELLGMARKLNIDILNNITISAIHETGSRVEMESVIGTLCCSRAIVATNGFAARLLKLDAVKPARAQVLVTKPVQGLKIKGAFHYHKGYFYFRNIDNRLLLGGGRHLDFAGETTTEHGINKKIQGALDRLLKDMILPDLAFEVDRRWTGIMGVGSEKKPIIEFAGRNVLAAVRMGGMGVAIGSLVGERAAKKIAG